MTTHKEALKLALEALEDNQHLIADNERHAYVMEYNSIIEKCKEALAQPEQDKERCVGCDACIDTACGRDECPKGWPKAAQPEQEPVGEAYLCDRCQTPFDGAYECPSCGHNEATKEPVYTTPPQRKPLTDEELRVIENKINPTMRWRSSDEEGITLYPQEYYELVRAIEAAHGIKD